MVAVGGALPALPPRRGSRPPPARYAFLRSVSIGGSGDCGGGADAADTHAAEPGAEETTQQIAEGVSEIEDLVQRRKTLPPPLLGPTLSATTAGAAGDAGRRHTGPLLAGSRRQTVSGAGVGAATATATATAGPFGQYRASEVRRMSRREREILANLNSLTPDEVDLVEERYQTIRRTSNAAARAARLSLSSSDRFAGGGFHTFQERVAGIKSKALESSVREQQVRGKRRDSLQAETRERHDSFVQSETMRDQRCRRAKRWAALLQHAGFLLHVAAVLAGERAGRDRRLALQLKHRERMFTCLNTTRAVSQGSRDRCLVSWVTRWRVRRRTAAAPVVLDVLRVLRGMHTACSRLRAYMETVRTVQRWWRRQLLALWARTALVQEQWRGAAPVSGVGGVADVPGFMRDHVIRRYLRERVVSHQRMLEEMRRLRDTGSGGAGAGVLPLSVQMLAKTTYVPPLKLVAKKEVLHGIMAEAVWRTAAATSGQRRLSRSEAEDRAAVEELQDQMFHTLALTCVSLAGKVAAPVPRRGGGSPGARPRVCVSQAAGGRAGGGGGGTPPKMRIAGGGGRLVPVLPDVASPQGGTLIQRVDGDPQQSNQPRRPSRFK